jgi:ribosomal protein S18 acetylase RimI-like enzyme
MIKENNNIIVRRAKDDDLELVAETLFKGGLAKTLKEGKDMFLRESKRGDVYLIALEGKKPLGIVSWIFQGAYRHELSELYHICVLPEARGKGVGKKLFFALLDDINSVYEKKNKKLRKLYLLTHADNITAQKFYEKIGMVHEASLKDHFYKGKDEFVYAYYP